MMLLFLFRSDKRVNEWKTPGKKAIVRCAVNQRQVHAKRIAHTSPYPIKTIKETWHSFCCCGSIYVLSLKN